MAEQTDMLGMAEGDDPTSIIGRDLSDVPQSKWAGMLAAMVEVLEQAHVRRGIEPAVAFVRARDDVLTLAEYWGGRMVYLPRGDRLRNALRDAEIYRRARRGNVQALAIEFKLTDIQVYRICREQKALHLRKVQGRLFED